MATQTPEQKYIAWQARFQELLMAEYRIAPSDVGYDEEAMRLACFSGETPDELVSQLGAKYGLTPSSEFHTWTFHKGTPV